MRKPITLTQHGNSVRVTLPPHMRRYLGWVGGHEVMMVVKDKTRIEIVDLETYLYENKAERDAERRAEEAQAIA
jgi:antitoxin component of MazEF toxin-antitoxin module